MCHNSQAVCSSSNECRSRNSTITTDYIVQQIRSDQSHWLYTYNDTYVWRDINADVTADEQRTARDINNKRNSQV